jgi:hypothetical protein
MITTRKMGLNLFLVLSLMISSFSTFAQDAEKKEQNLIQTVGEVMLKGSIDGKSIFMVYGLGDMAEDVKSIGKSMDLKDVIDMEGLEETGLAIYNKDHIGDIVGTVKMGAKAVKPSLNFAKDGLENIKDFPLKSLKRMKNSHQVSFENAREAKAGADNELTGVIKYSGHAIWAHTKNAYFLIVEVPVVAAAAVLQTLSGVVGAALAVPGAIVLSALKITFQAAGTAISTTVRIGWRGLKVGAMGVMAAYSTVSAGVATVATLVAAGGVAIVKGTKFVIVDLPKKLLRPASAKVATDIAFEEQEEFAKRALETIKTNSALSNNIGNIKKTIAKYKSKITISLKVGAKTVKAFILNLNIKNKLVQIKGEASRKYFKALRNLDSNSDRSRKEIKKQIQAELDELVELIQAS